MNRNCEYTDGELTALLLGSRAELEEAMRCLLKGRQLERETIAFLLKKGAQLQDAEEAYSEGLKVFFMNIVNRKFEGQSSPKTYFMGICRNIWLGKKKGAWHSRTSFLENALDKDRLLSETPDQKVELESLAQRIDQLLDLTSERCKEMYRLETEGYSRAEIAEITGLSSEEYAKIAAYRCRQKLREIIKNSPEWTDFFKTYLDGK